LATDVDVCAEVVLPWEFPETRPSAALSITFNDRCDAVVATARVDPD
jgi:hypothetical protein